jgi:hypothetical protein
MRAHRCHAAQATAARRAGPRARAAPRAAQSASRADEAPSASRRTFLFVPYGDRFDATLHSICCDGLVQVRKCALGAQRARRKRGICALGTRVSFSASRRARRTACRRPAPRRARLTRASSPPPQGAGLHLTHWTSNATPARFYADLSADIAARFVASPEASAYDDAVVVNNHYDTDGCASAAPLSLCASSKTKEPRMRLCFAPCF